MPVPVCKMQLRNFPVTGCLMFLGRGWIPCKLTTEVIVGQSFQSALRQLAMDFPHQQHLQRLGWVLKWRTDKVKKNIQEGRKGWEVREQKGGRKGSEEEWRKKNKVKLWRGKGGRKEGRRRNKCKVLEGNNWEKEKEKRKERRKKVN